MSNIAKTPNKKRGRPNTRVIEPINDTPERIAKSIMLGPPKKKWDYLVKKPSKTV